MEEYLRVGSELLGTSILFLIISIWYVRRHRYKLVDISKADFDLPINHSYTMSPMLNRQFNFSESVVSQPATSSQKEEVLKEQAVQETKDSSLDSILIISVFAKPNSTFGSYDLLQAITATGMQFGDMNIFHYYAQNFEGRVKLFSLASATKPGHFTLDRIGDFSCVGLTLFMDLQAVPNPENAFNIMLATAEQLADDLDGELRAGPQRSWNEKILDEYQKKILQYS